MYSLKEINEMVREHPEEFVENCDLLYNERVSRVVDAICENLDKSPIVLLSGPSGSGKTTSALKIEEELRRRGIMTHTVSMDNYFKTVDLRTVPRTPEGEIDFESPALLDMELLNEHFTMLTEGKEIRIPYFMFARQKRSASRSTPMRLGKNEIAIFEGIHALNDAITDRHPEAMTLYVYVATPVEDESGPIFHPDWTRLLRRSVRDSKFRGSDAEFTLSVWDNVMRGEEEYISPFTHKAKLRLDSSHAYEVPLLKGFAEPLFAEISEEAGATRLMSDIKSALPRFETLDPAYIKPESLLREFIGGGVYEY